MENPQPSQPSPLKIRSEPRGPRGTIAGAAPRTWTDRRRPVQLEDLRSRPGVFRRGAALRRLAALLMVDGYSAHRAHKLRLPDLLAGSVRLSQATWSALATLLRRCPERLQLGSIIGDRKRTVAADLRAALPQLRAVAASRRVEWTRASPAAVATFAALLAAAAPRPDHLRPDRHLP